jgi:prevent-host-death family protein
VAQITEVEFQRNFGEVQDQARREPVEIARHGRRELVLISAEHYDWLVAAARHTHRTTEAVSVVVEAVRRSELRPEHAHLDRLLKWAVRLTLSEPQSGLVIRYLWTREAAAERYQGKDRPACLVAATDSTPIPRFVVSAEKENDEKIGQLIAIR